MSEATKQIVTQHSPLHETHVRLGATMRECDNWFVPASYNDVLFEYAAVRERGAGVIDLSSRGRFRVSGSEAVSFLNGLITNDMKTLTENRWMPAAFPNVQGRLIASVRVVRLPDDTTGKTVPVFLIDTEAATHKRVLNAIQRFTLAGDFHVDDLTSQVALMSVQGKKAVEIIGSLLGQAPSGLPANGVVQVEWQQETLTVLRATHTAEDGFDLIVSANNAPALWKALVDAGGCPVGHDALEMLRIEAGVPRYGLDMDENNVVTEVLDEAVSYTKGCYVGQEIIARIKYRGHVAKKLTGVMFERLVKLESGAAIKFKDDKEVGRITSAVSSPHLGRSVALAFVKYDSSAPGTEVSVSADRTEPAVVTEPPFVRGSWYSLPNMNA
ncbi:MAG: aminomethyltransferase family protein [Pyrinomonadaceae bacterium]